MSRTHLRRSLAALVLVFLATTDARADAAPRTAADYVASAATLREAMVRGYLTPTLRRKAKGDTLKLVQTIEIALQMERLGIHRRQVRRVQAEFLRNVRGSLRQVELELRMFLRAARVQGLITRREEEHAENSTLDALTLIESKQLVDRGYLTRGHAARAGLHRPLLRRLAEISELGDVLGVKASTVRSLQADYLRHTTDIMLRRVRRKLIAEAYDLPRSAILAPVSARTVLDLLTDAAWLGDGVHAVREPATWQAVRKHGYDAGMWSVLRANHPDMPKEAFWRRDFSDVLEGLRLAAVLRADVKNPGYWRDVRRLKAERLTSARLAQRWRGTSTSARTILPRSTTSSQVKVSPGSMRNGTPKIQARLQAFVDYAEHLRSQGRWSRAEPLFVPRREGSVAWLAARYEAVQSSGQHGSLTIE